MIVQSTDSGGRRSRTPALIVVAAIAAVAPAAALALPPGGVNEEPGTPPGSVSVTNPEVAKQGTVGFCVRNFRVNLAGGGSVGQQFMVKFDDFGSYGIGPFTPDNNGDLCAEVSMNPADHATAKGGAADKIPSDLCDANATHLLRFLSGSWAYNKADGVASMRSLHADFRTTATCTEPAPTGGSGSTTPGTGGTGGGATTIAPLPTVASRTVGTNGRTLRLTFRPVTAHTVVSFGLRTRTKVRVGKQMRIVRLVSATRVEIPADGRSHTATFRLTPAGRQVVGARTRNSGVLVITPGSGAARGVPMTVIRSGK